ncbi:periplasmic heavy metal sensor [Paraburkholderia xenovorans]|uniref:periplasmic heavy metal sensor n=1 Tax=Paraburkholderia xenovorans TaxID=36873 RepID=UPI0038B85E98
MSSRSWKFVLVASLAVNVFLLGGIAGGAYQWFAARDAATEAQQRALRFAATPLSVDRQKEFADALKDARRDGRGFARDARAGRREVLRLLAAPQLDRTALDRALERTRTADSNLRALVETNVADFAETLTSEERIEFADSLRVRGEWREPPGTLKNRLPASNSAASGVGNSAASAATKQPSSGASGG